MLTIKYPSENVAVRDWRALLEEIVVAHKMEEIKSLDQPVLEEDDATVRGEKEIYKYLKELKKSVDDWRAPGCGI